MNPFKPWRSFADPLRQLQDRGLLVNNPSDHPSHAVSAGDAIAAQGMFPC